MTIWGIYYILYSYNLYYIKKNDHTYDIIIIIILNEIMEIMRQTIGCHGPGPKLPAMYDFCK